MGVDQLEQVVEDSRDTDSPQAKSWGGGILNWYDKHLIDHDEKGFKAVLSVIDRVVSVIERINRIGDGVERRAWEQIERLHLKKPLIGVGYAGVVAAIVYSSIYLSEKIPEWGPKFVEYLKMAQQG